MKILHVLVLGSAALLGACSGAPVHPATPVGTASAQVKSPGDARVGDRTTCPVSGEEFVVTELSPKVEHEGKTYYFCCEGCDKKFEADPQKYLSKPKG